MPHVHSCDALIVTCIDFRIQKFIEDWLNSHLGKGKYDRVAWAGGIFDSAGVIKQVDISVRLHSIKKLILMNHEDCGAYGQAGTYEKHTYDLINIKKKICKIHTKLKIETYYIYLNGEFKKIQ